MMIMTSHHDASGAYALAVDPEERRAALTGPDGDTRVGTMSPLDRAEIAQIAAARAWTEDSTPYVATDRTTVDVVGVPVDFGIDADLIVRSGDYGIPPHAITFDTEPEHWGTEHVGYMHRNPENGDDMILCDFCTFDPEDPVSGDDVDPEEICPDCGRTFREAVVETPIVLNHHDGTTTRLRANALAPASPEPILASVEIRSGEDWGAYAAIVITTEEDHTTVATMSAGQLRTLIDTTTTGI